MVTVSAWVEGTGADEPKKATTAEEIREAKLFDAIGEMAVRRDELLKKFAVVMWGEYVSTGNTTEPVYTSTQTYARVVDRKRKFDLRAHFTDRQHYCDGYETVEWDGLYKARDNRQLLRHGYLIKPPEQKLSEWRQEFRAAGCDPYDDWVAGLGGLLIPGSGSGVEKILLRNCELVRTEDSVGGVLRSFWKLNPSKDIDFSIQIDFSGAYEMMPVHYKLVANDMKDYWEKISIDWRPHGKYLLPHRIKYAGNNLPPQSHKIYEYTLRCFWAVGDEVPEAVFASEDHLATLLEHFELADVIIEKDKTVYLPRELPEDLFQDIRK